MARRTVDIARAIGHSTRMAVLDRLREGEATVGELVDRTGTTQPNVSNHLAVLVRAGLVRGNHEGRTVLYRLANPHISALLRSLDRAAGSVPRRPRDPHPVAMARSCYDHAGGRLGVRLLDGLVRRGALKRPTGSGRDVTLGPRAAGVFEVVGVDLAAARRPGRRYAFGCLDWTERRPHLGGSLGSALLNSLLEAGWVERVPGTRALTVTDRGRRALRRHLFVSLG